MDSESVGELYSVASEFRWVVDTSNFSDYKRDDYTTITSPTFYTFRNSKKLKWKFELYPKGTIDSPKGYMTIFLTNLNDFKVVISCSFSIITVYYSKVSKTESDGRVEIKSQGSYGFDIVHEKFVWYRRKILLKDDKLTFSCKINDIHKINTITYQTSLVKVKTYEKLLKDEKYSDITVTAAGKSFQLHKCVLATHSIIFDKMFETDMKEKATGIVEIKDVRPEVLHSFFQYLYTNEVGDIKIVVSELLCAAEKYAVADLKRICEEVMSGQINMENALNYLEIAEKNNALNLKKRILEFIASNLKNFTDNPAFKSFGESCPELLFEIMKVIGHMK